jgi:hypothetical protein
MYTTFSIGTSCIVKNNEYAVPPPGAFHPDIPVHLLCLSTSLVVEHERAGETRVRQRACHFRQAMRAGVPRCGTLLHIYVVVLYMCKRVPHRGTPARIACRKWQARWRTRVSPARSCSTTSDVDKHSKCTGMSGWKAPGGGTAYSLFFTIQLVPIEKVVYMMNSE